MSDNGESSYRRILQGDQSAFDEIMDAYREKLIFFIMGYVGNAQTAQDIAMDTFVEILVHPNRFKFKSSLKTYIYSIARHKTVDFLRRNREVPGETDIYEVYESDLLESIIQQENSRMLLDAMKKISADYRTVLHLIYFDECDSDEVAKIMGKSKKQLANLTYRAKQALKAELEKEGFCYEEQ